MASREERTTKIGVRSSGASWRIAGHTDQRRDANYNHKLSLERANAVKAYLVEKGAQSAQVIVAAYGETRSLTEKDKKGSGVTRDVHFFDRRVVVDFDVDVTAQLTTRG